MHKCNHILGYSGHGNWMYILFKHFLNPASTGVLSAWKLVQTNNYMAEPPQKKKTWHRSILKSQELSHEKKLSNIRGLFSHTQKG